ncbi:MAG: hypothetical protein AAB511_03285 [Patescibacteria group bacterium]
MLSIRPQQQIVEKVLKTKAGGYVRAQFLVTEYQGRIHVKLLSATPIFDNVSDFSAEVVQALPSKITKATFERVLEQGEVIASTFFDFNFLVSQPTRAPAGNF